MQGFKKISLAFVFSIVTGLSMTGSAEPAQPFDQWLVQLRQDAIAQGVSEDLVNRALNGIQPDAEVVRLDMPKNQAEFSETFAQYAAKRVSAARIERGREMLKKHWNELQRISNIYGVAPQYIVALWGMETNYGSYTGNKDIVRALATLAWHGRDGTSPKRAAFFRKELINALQIVDQGHFTLDQMKGSWAGAFGQFQFMPSSFLNLAKDGDGDGKINIRDNLSDAFASAANYLARSNWHDGERLSREVRLPKGFDTKLIGLDTKKSLDEWRRLGLKTTSGQPIPVVAGMKASVLAPDGLSGPVYLVYNNFHTVKRWNNSNSFALSVGLLADAIAAAKP